jgi:hypothetical protein
VTARSREEKLREAIKRLISAYGRGGRAQDSAVKHAQRVLIDTEWKNKDDGEPEPISNWRVPVLP